MFKLKEFENSKIKYDTIAEIKNKLENLQNIISELKFIEVGINQSKSPNAFDFILVSHFDNSENLKKYRFHPSHINVVEFINRFKESSAVVDYEK